MFFLIVNFLLTSCIPGTIVPPAPWQDWVIDDVLWLSPGATNPNDLIAAYFRRAESACQFRFDFLNYYSSEIYTFQILLYTHAPISNLINQPDYTLVLPSKSEAFLITRFDQNKSTQGIQVFRNPALDGIVLQLTNQELCTASNLTFRVNLILADGSMVGSTPLISRNDPSPPAAYLLLAFWDTLPASTPLQLLRRWDGAHTGPFGQRHGLKILAEAAEKYQVPIFLLDLKQPNSLAGLELVDQTAWIRQLQQNHVIYLPDSSWGSTLAKKFTLDLAQEVANNYDLQNSQLYFSIDGSSNPKHAGYFSFTQNPAPVLTSDSFKIFPMPYLPGQPTPEWITQSVTSDGLSDYVLQTLLSNADHNEENKILVLGGSLPSSLMADLTVAEPIMSYISAHPWIQVVSQDDLMSSPAKPPNNELSKIASSPSKVEEDIYQAIKTSHKDDFSNSEWEMFLNLTNVKVQDPSFPILQSYLTQIYNLLEASKWIQKPQERTECNLDLDKDGSQECILSNNHILLILDPLGGRLEFAAGCNTAGFCSEIIGSSAQLSAGLSDANSWNTNHPYNQDLDVIPGALDDLNPDPLLYTIAQGPDFVSFSNFENMTTKIYTLLQNGFQIQVETNNPQTLLIPLIVEPNNRSQPNWPSQYVYQEISSSRFSWGLVDEYNFDIDISGAEFQFSSFIQAISTIREPENPDLDYPNFFFMPFPLATIQVEPSNNWVAHFILR